MDDLTQEFLVESSEGLDRMERCLLKLEAEPGNPALLDEIFRAVHTIKGTTGFLAFPRLEKLSHTGETFLGLLRDGKLQATRNAIDGLLALLDGLRAMLREIAAEGHEGPGNIDADEALIAKIQGLHAVPAAADAAAAMRNQRTDMQAPHPVQAAGETTLRVEVETLNQMLNLVGELVLTRNQIALHAKDEQSVKQARRLDAVTTDLRESMMQARTQPVAQLFGRLPRMVRDLSERLGRCVRLELSGQETRLDKTLLDALRDPLMHLLRNAIDHGIEPPAERVRCGKALEATLHISAFHEGGQVVLEVSDDGAGIDSAVVKRRAVSKGLIQQAAADALSPAAATKLIFLPGFSTREEVSVTSGRGVGMDIVRANVEGLGGTVELESALGIGTKIRMRVPLTLAIVPALVVRSGGCNFAFPRADIRELMVIHRRDEDALVQRIGGSVMLRARGRMVPLLSLSAILNLSRNDDSGYYVLVVESAGQAFGVVVDDLDEQQEIVVKALAAVLSADGLFSGASTLGNGELAFIVDVGQLAAACGITREDTCFHSGAEHESEEPLAAEGKPSAALLLYESLDGARCALALDQVERIEKVAVERIEVCRGRLLVQHEGSVMELQELTARPLDIQEPLTVIVCQQRNGRVCREGIVVRAVVDIVAAGAVVEDVSGLAIVRDRVVSIRPPAIVSREAWREAA